MAVQPSGPYSQAIGHCRQLGFQWQQWHEPSAEVSLGSLQMIEMPSGFLLWMYCSIWNSKSMPPEWVPTAWNLRTSSPSFARHQGSRHCESFPLSSNGNPGNALWTSLDSAERLIIIILNSLHDNPYGCVISEAGSNICFVILKIN